MKELAFPSSIEIENFKGFGRRVSVPLAPITLLYGENSAGKSAIIQLLTMLRQTLDLGVNDPILVSRDAKGLIDLGRYADYVHDHDTKRNISVSFLSAEGGAKGFTAGYDAKLDAVIPRKWSIKSAKGEFDFHPACDSKLPEPADAIFMDVMCDHGEMLCQCAAQHPEVVIAGISRMIRLRALAQLDATAGIASSEIVWSADPLRRLVLELESKYALYLELLRTNPKAGDICKHTELLSYRFYAADDRGGAHAWQPPAVDLDSIALPALESWLLAGANNVAITQRAEPDFDVGDFSGYTPSGWGIMCEEPSQGRNRYIINKGEIRKYPLKVRANSGRFVLGREWGSVSEYDGVAALKLSLNSLSFTTSGLAVASVPSCHDDSMQGVDEEVVEAPMSISDDEIVNETTQFPHSIIEKDPTLSSFPCNCDTGVRVSSISRFLSIGPLRQEPARWYEVYDLPRPGVGRKGEHTAEFLRQRPELQESVNGWLKRLGIEYVVRVDKVVPMEAMPALGIMRLTDSRRQDCPANTIADVGMGISQVLPIVTECLFQNDQWIGIEQPELHIHPKLQAEMGALFAESYKEKGNHFLIETHSEHLMLRLQRLIRRGVLTAEDVSVVYVSRGEQGSTVDRLRLNEGGEFIDEWPGGFFEEGYREIFGD